MQTSFTAILLLVLAISCSADHLTRHAVHVDNVFPNFGDTVLISGPFTTTNLRANVLNVGVLNVDSIDGVNITTTGSFSIDGSSFDGVGAETVSIRTTDEDSTFSVVAASTIDFLGPSMTFSSDASMSISALGSFEFIAGGLFTLNANAAVLTGENLEITSASDSIFFRAGESFVSSSSALAVKATNDINIASETVRFDAQQSIEVISSGLSMSTDVLSLTAVRNNILLEGYTLLSLEAALFDVQVKGDATIESSNGNLLFSDITTLLFEAQDDVVLESHDSVRYSATNGDILLSSTGNTFLVGDAESYYNYNGDGLFSASATFSSVSGEFYIETTAGNVGLTASDGTFTSTSADYTHVLGDSKVAITSSDDFTLTGSQGIDVRAERGRLYVGKLPADPSGPTPIIFNSENDLFFDAGDLSMTVNTIDISADDVRFETADTARNAIQDWNIENDMDFTTTTFSLGSSGVTVSSDNDLSLSAGGIVTITANENAASSIQVSNQFAISDTADNVSHNGKYWTLSSAGNGEFTSTNDFNIGGVEGVFLHGDTTFFLTTDQFENDVEWISTYQAGNTFAIDAANSVLFSGGEFDLDNSGNFEITSNDDGDFSISATNIDLDSDGIAEYLFDDTDYSASRYTMIHGDISFTGYDVVSFEGNFYVVSPLGTDISIDSEDTVTTNGPIDFSGHNVEFDVGDTISFTPFVFNMESFTENPIDFTSEALTVDGDDILFDHATGDQDNEFLFEAPALTMESLEEFLVASEADTTITAGTSISQDISDDVVINANIVDIRATDTLTFDSLGKIEITPNHDWKFVAEHGDITADFSNYDIYSLEGSVFLRSLEGVAWTSLDDVSISAPREFTYRGNDVLLDANNIAITSQTDIDIHASSSMTFSAAQNLDLDVSTTMTITGSDISAVAADENSLNSDGKLSVIAGPNRALTVTQTDVAGTTSITGDNVNYQSNDLMNIVIDGSWDSFSDDFFQETSAQDAGQLYYSDTSFSYNVVDTIEIIVGDTAHGGSDVEFIIDEVAVFSADDSIAIGASGYEYDPNFDFEVSVLSRSEQGNVILETAEMQIFAQKGISWESLNGDISHTSTLGDVIIVSQTEGMRLNSANEITMETDVGNFEVTLQSYSIWEAVDEIRIIAETDFSLDINGGGDLDIIADRGLIGFHYAGDNVMVFQANAIVYEGAAAASFEVGNNLDVNAGTSIEIYGDSLLDIESGDNLSISSEDAYFISSLNNDIDFTSESLVATVTDEISFYGRRDVVFDGDDASNTYIAGRSMFFTSEGSVAITGDNALFQAAAPLRWTSSNLIEFESESSIDVGVGTGSIISISAGGDSTDHGVEIIADDEISHTSQADISLTAADFNSDTESLAMTAVNSVSILSQGSDSFGEDVFFDTTGVLAISSAGGETKLTAASVRFEHDDDFQYLSTAGKTVFQSATFIDIDADGSMTEAVVASSYTVDAESFAYNSDDVTQMNMLQSILFKTSQTSSFEADANILFNGGAVSFKTAQSNSPIVFETQGVVSEFNIEGATGSFTAAGKTEIEGANGVLFESTGAITLSAADDFTVDTSGDFTLESVTGDVKIQGTATTIGSRMDFSSSATLLQHALKDVTINANSDFSIIADEDILFYVPRFLDLGDPYAFAATVVPNEISITATDDLIAQNDGSYVIDVGSYSVTNFNSLEWQMAGIWTEESIGARFSTVGTTSVVAGTINNVADNIYIEAGGGVSIASTTTTDVTTVGKQTFETTEQGSAIIVFASDLVTMSAEGTVSASAFGEKPSSGFILIRSNEQSNDILYPWYPFKTSASFVSATSDDGLNADVSISVDDARVVYDSQSLIEVQSGEDGVVQISAAGADENGIGIEIQAADVIITSVNNVGFAAENIRFIEVATDPYVLSTTPVFDPIFGNLLNRPTFESVHDQTYVSSGLNQNGNGIEITSEIPANNIHFLDTDNVNFDSSERMNINAQHALQFTTTFNMDFDTHSTMYITGEGSSTDRNSISISSAVPPAGPTPVVGTMEFNAEKDIIMETSNELFAYASDTMFFHSAGDLVIDGGDVQISANSDSIILNINALSVSTDGDIFISGQDVLFDASVNLDFVADGADIRRSNIYFGSDREGGLPGTTMTIDGDVVMIAHQIDIPSHNELVMEARTNTPGCIVGSTRFWFERANGGDIYTLNFCDVTGAERIIRLYDRE